MASYLLDTDAIIDYLAAFPSSVAFIQRLFDQGDSLCTSDVVIAEVYAGLRPQDRTRAERLLGALQFLTTALEAARQAGEWRYQYARRGVAIATTDALVAATAFFHGAGIITANTTDYPMPEVTVVPLPRAAP